MLLLLEAWDAEVQIIPSRSSCLTSNKNGLGAMGQHCVAFSTRQALPVCVTTHAFALDNQSKKDGLCSLG